MQTLGKYLGTILVCATLARFAYNATKAAKFFAKPSDAESVANQNPATTRVLTIRLLSSHTTDKRKPSEGYFTQVQSSSHTVLEINGEKVSEDKSEERPADTKSGEFNHVAILNGGDGALKIEISIAKLLDPDKPDSLITVASAGGAEIVKGQESDLTAGRPV